MNRVINDLIEEEFEKRKDDPVTAAVKTEIENASREYLEKAL